MVSTVAAGLIKSSALIGWVVVVLGVLLAIAGSVFSANNRCATGVRHCASHPVRDIWDFAYLVLPTASPADAFTQLGAIHTEWEPAGG